MKTHVNSHSVIKARAHWMLLIWCFMNNCSWEVWISSTSWYCTVTLWCFVINTSPLWSGSGFICMDTSWLSSQTFYFKYSAQICSFFVPTKLQSHFRALLTGLLLTRFSASCGQTLNKKVVKNLHDVILPWGGQQSLQDYWPYNIHLSPTLKIKPKFEVVTDLHLQKHSSSAFLPLYCLSSSKVQASCQ